MEKEMATHSSILAWRIPWTEKPGGLQSTGSQRVRNDPATSLSSDKIIKSPNELYMPNTVRNAQKTGHISGWSHHRGLCGKKESVLELDAGQYSSGWGGRQGSVPWRLEHSTKPILGLGSKPVQKGRGWHQEEQRSHSVQFSSVPQSCPTLGDPMDCSTPGFPIHHQLQELTQTHVH